MDIKLDKEAQKFYSTNKGKESYVLYRMKDENTIDIFRTYVPPEQRHKGLAGKIVKAVLEYAIPTCSYTEYFIDQNKEYKKLLA
jgi:predicted GNAT family acetyltransferase